MIIVVQQSIVRGVGSSTLKSRYRVRQIQITNRIRAILEEILARTARIFSPQSAGKPYLR
jgi:hypothetical protein